MIRRAYRPKDSTLRLIEALNRRADISHAAIIAPHRGAHPKPARILIVDTRGERTTVSLAKARQIVKGAP